MSPPRPTASPENGHGQAEAAARRPVPSRRPGPQLPRRPTGASTLGFAILGPALHDPAGPTPRSRWTDAWARTDPSRTSRRRPSAAGLTAPVPADFLRDAPREIGSRRSPRRRMFGAPSSRCDHADRDAARRLGRAPRPRRRDADRAPSTATAGWAVYRSSRRSVKVRRCGRTNRRTDAGEPAPGGGLRPSWVHARIAQVARRPVVRRRRLLLSHARTRRSTSGPGTSHRSRSRVIGSFTAQVGVRSPADLARAALERLEADRGDRSSSPPACSCIGAMRGLSDDFDTGNALTYVYVGGPRHGGHRAAPALPSMGNQTTGQWRTSERRGWDSNPRGSVTRPHDFQSCTFSRSVTSPERLLA